jgi:hypothetical protein
MVTHLVEEHGPAGSGVITPDHPRLWKPMRGQRRRVDMRGGLSMVLACGTPRHQHALPPDGGVRDDEEEAAEPVMFSFSQTDSAA